MRVFGREVSPGFVGFSAAYRLSGLCASFGAMLVLMSPQASGQAIFVEAGGGLEAPAQVVLESLDGGTFSSSSSSRTAGSVVESCPVNGGENPNKLVDAASRLFDSISRG